MRTQRWSPAHVAVVELAILFLPGIPAFFWLWPAARHRGMTKIAVLGDVP